MLPHFVYRVLSIIDLLYVVRLCHYFLSLIHVSLLHVLLDLCRWFDVLQFIGLDRLAKAIKLPSLLLQLEMSNICYSNVLTYLVFFFLCHHGRHAVLEILLVLLKSGLFPHVSMFIELEFVIICDSCKYFEVSAVIWLLIKLQVSSGFDQFTEVIRTAFAELF